MNLNQEIESLYFKLYGKQSNKALDELFDLMKNAKLERKQALIEMDKAKDHWYFNQSNIGMTLYVDLFAGSLKNIEDKIDYFKDLGITFIHFMPLLKPRDGENDGGYAVEDYRQIDSKLGNLDEFIHLSDKLRKNGIFVCIDYVINHVAKEHIWAQEAINGDVEKQAYFIMFDTDKIPKEYDKTVPEVLPDKCPGNFTYYPEIEKYVFTSFSEFQWDLNFKNPYVLNGMIDNLLYLANLGVNMIRLDAIPFMWKELGTSCRNLDPIHTLLQLIQCVKTEVCPSLALLGEAIVEAEEIVKYFGKNEAVECEVMYNANLMVNVFNSFATRDVRLLHIDTNRFNIPHNGTWMNYVRCHDDIGWGFNEKAIQSFGFDARKHKQFLIDFYGDNFSGSFASGEDYQFNPVTLDARTNGTLASLLGLEKALIQKNTYRIFESIRRINLAHALILAYRGFPLIYSGDEIATINNQVYKTDPNKMNEGRWVHRAFFDWERAKLRNDSITAEYMVFQNLKKLIQIRKELSFLNGQANQFSIDCQNMHVYCLVRSVDNDVFFALFNFSETTQKIQIEQLSQICKSSHYLDKIQGREINMNDYEIELTPYEYLWCVALS